MKLLKRAEAEHVVANSPDNTAHLARYYLFFHQKLDCCFQRRLYLYWADDRKELLNALIC